uniref:Cadherin domain-containing protein n=1 Tax=Sinocyclocheilus rhinocerous TaxID=307959 RepID=A0A673KWE0_9TELE
VENHIYTFYIAGEMFGFLFFVLTAHIAYGDVSYSFPEEMKRGSVIGNIATDLGLDVNRLSFRKARVDAEGNRKRYCDINVNTGELTVAERIDREGLCGKRASCVLNQDFVLENPLELHRISLRVKDVNDNSPNFGKDEINLEIRESADKGKRFLLEANDADIGQNSVQSYAIQSNGYFILSVQSNSLGEKYAELILNKEFDREHEQEVTLILTAVDGGTPPRSGTVAIHVTVLDANDNAPVFSQAVYKVSLPENSPLDTVVVTVSATDADEGQNGEVTYDVMENYKQLFYLGRKTGIISIKGPIDFEEEATFSLRIIAKDGSGLTSYSNVIISVSDINDNAPILIVKSLNSPIPENALPGTEVENPMELHPVTIEILDENDHAPSFQNKELKFEISESATLGSRFLLESADDHDVGLNSLQNYILSPNNHFVLKQHSNTDGGKYAEMVLQKALDREERPHLSLKLIAVDGGNPQRSGSVNIDVTVLDANDNAPVFNQTVYRAYVLENAPKGTYITAVNATDADAGLNGRITYNFYKQKGAAAQLFNIDRDTGIVSVVGEIDHEKYTKFELTVEARDQGGLTDLSKIALEVADVNDNAPVINTMSFSSTVSENAPSDTTIAIINVKDSDTDDNGKVNCFIEGSEDFTIKSTLRNYYSLVTSAILDREQLSEYNITVIATDSGKPPLTSRHFFYLKVTDVNDNPPVFQESVYNSNLLENNSPGVSILTIRARDPDENQNARISYIIEESDLGGSPVGTYVSVNAESGVVHAVRSFDYEQIKNIKITIKAQDGGSPPLCSNVTVNIFIQDQNDNAPQVLYPVQSGASVVAEIVPRSADVGYLVTKVVAVDVDSGQNAWLSYKLQKATDRALFEVGLQNGEIRTVRQVTDKDAVKQRLTVVVEDNGQPSRSATVNVNVAVADSFPEVLSEFTDFTHDKEYNNNLTLYLVLALAAVSFLFITCLVVIVSVKIYRWRQSQLYYKSNLPVIPYYPPRYADTVGTGTLQHAYNYEVYRTTDSRRSDCKFVRPASQNVAAVDLHDFSSSFTLNVCVMLIRAARL